MKSTQEDKVYTIAEIKALAKKFEQKPLNIRLSAEDLRTTARLLRDFAMFIEFVGWNPPTKPH